MNGEGRQITGKWFGLITGTNRGIILVDLSETGDRITGEATLGDSQYGESKFRLSGKREGGRFEFALDDFRSSTSTTPRFGSATLELSGDGGEIHGQWKTDLGTNGTLNAFRLESQSGGAVAQAAASAVQPPNSYVSQEVPLPACWLDRSGFVGLVQVATRGMSVVPTIQAKIGGQFVRKVGVDAFLNDSTLPSQLTNLQLYAGEPHRTVTITLSDYQRSTAVVWASDPTWAEGKAQEILHYLGSRRSWINDLYRRHSGWLGLSALALMLIVLPAVPRLGGRALLVVSTFLVVFVLGRLYQKILPATTVLLREIPDAGSSLMLGKIFASVVTAVALGVLAYLWNLVTPYWPSVEMWFSTAFR